MKFNILNVCIKHSDNEILKVLKKKKRQLNELEMSNRMRKVYYYFITTYVVCFFPLQKVQYFYLTEYANLNVNDLKSFI